MVTNIRMKKLKSFKCLVSLLTIQNSVHSERKCRLEAGINLLMNPTVFVLSSSR
jgi:hypothetical protein